MNRPEATHESWIVVLLHGLALAVAAAAVLLQLSLPAGTLGALLGTAGAVIASGFVARSRVRLGTVWLVACGGAAMGLFLGRWLVDGTTAASVLGPRGAMAAGDVVRFGLLATALALALRTTTARYQSFAVVELALVALALAGVVAAHRDGAINHPRALSDWAWTRGRDPVDYLLWIGVGTAVALALALLRERRGRGARVLLHVGAAVGLAALVLMLVHVAGLPKPPRGSGGESSQKDDKGKDDKQGRGGGRGDRNAQGGGQGGQGQSSGANSPRQWEFKDSYDSPSEQSPVAVVLLHDDYSPPLGYYYFRQTAFSQYNGHRLIARTRDDVDRDILTDFPVERTAVPDPPRAAPERKSIETTVALMADHIRPFGLETPVEFAPRESPDPTRFVRAYDVKSAALAMKYEQLLGKRTWASSWSDEVRAAYTEIPNDVRYKQLADQIVDEFLRPEWRSDPFAQAIAINVWLSKNAIYSLKSKHADAGDPTADFLFGDRIGYCVHIAHAAAYLLRARGLPARMAGGYVADEGRKGSGSTIMLREKDAHAWAELYLDGFGWIIVDPAPERVLDPPDTPPDRDLQRMLGEMARQQKPLEQTPKKGMNLPSLRAVLFSLALLLATALLLLYSIKLWRWLAAYVAGPRSVYRVAYRSALDRLAEAGISRREGETRERFAARVAHVAPSLVTVTRHHVGAAYGGRSLAPPEDMRRLAFNAGDEAWRHTRTWRILLGVINPISWLWSR